MYKFRQKTSPYTVDVPWTLPRTATSRAPLRWAPRRAEQRAVGPGETFGCLRDRGLGDFMVNSGLSGGFNGGLMAQQWLNIGE